MFSSRRLYGIMALITIIYLIYVTYMNFIYDPQAADFLQHKAGLKKQVQLPIWLNIMYVHVGFACLAMISGALNFSQRLLTQYRRFHRINGYVYLAAIMLVDITSGYMAPYATGGKINSIAFNFLNLIWLVFTIAAIVQIKKKRVIKHRKWMIRSYAFCFTNLFIHLITTTMHRWIGLVYETSYTLGVYGSILSLLVIAEIIIRKQRLNK
ncbi:DUF2306 domain-containing protein [Paenibacillus sp. UNC451MF]|uniref:DUF2306 domain-containing protein n=1 Tax=Paenibacillus sp. UNC451MF TaxID=1449063 RepID=UPI00048D6B16|nr:DUF2306 domain-containing protein [Paenibacillus sp. UNC451MF]